MALRVPLDALAESRLEASSHSHSMVPGGLEVTS